MWTPSNTLLGTHKENEQFSYTISYEYTYTDELTSEDVTVDADILIEPTEVIDTIQIDGDTISGYSFDNFPITIKYLGKDKAIYNVTRFSNIVLDNLDQMVEYNASQSMSKTISFIVTASWEDEVIETETFTIVIQNDWTSGRDSLKAFVELTRG